MRRAILIAGSALALVGCAGSGPPAEAPSRPAAPSPSRPAAEGRAASSSAAAGSPSARPVSPQPAPGAPRVETFSTGLSVPWDLAFLPDGRLLVTERRGQVRLVERDGRVRSSPVARVQVSAQGEGGLLGLALDPQFAAGQPFAYLYATVGDEMQVQRWRVADDGGMVREEVVLDGIRAGSIHDSGRLRFGPDGHLYLATGDAGQGSLAQSKTSLNGKVLRLAPAEYRDRTDRPQVFSLGHRNPQGLAWQPGSGRLVITDHGPSGFDGLSCCDEVDVVEQGANYGWPAVFGRDHDDYRAPVMLWQKTIAPSGAAFVSRPGSSWTDSLVVAALRGRALHRLTFRGGEVTGEQILLQQEFGRLRAVVEGPDGALYVTTSNRDGRGTPQAGDDRILRIVPPVQ